ncbi:unknown [Akkermansia muciniphila CAG:154]|nr:unknown [Akkermansia muciniphila CAG:154]
MGVLQVESVGDGERRVDRSGSFPYRAQAHMGAASRREALIGNGAVAAFRTRQFQRSLRDAEGLPDRAVPLQNLRAGAVHGDAAFSAERAFIQGIPGSGDFQGGAVVQRAASRQAGNAVGRVAELQHSVAVQVHLHAVKLGGAVERQGGVVRHLEHAGSGNGAVGKFGTGSREREGTVFPDGEVAAVAFIRQRSRFRLPGNVQGGKVAGVGGVELDGAEVRRAGEDELAVLHVQRAAGIQGSGKLQGAVSRLGDIGRPPIDGSGVLRIGTGRIRIGSQQLVVQDDGSRLVVRAGDVDNAGSRTGKIVDRQAVSRIVHAGEVEGQVAVHDDRAVRVQLGIVRDRLVFASHGVNLRGVPRDADGASVDARHRKAQGFQQRVEDGRTVAQRSVGQVEPRRAVPRAPALHGVNHVSGEGKGERFNFQLRSGRVKLNHGSASGQVLRLGDVPRAHHQAGAVQIGGAVDAADDRSGVRHVDGLERGTGKAAQGNGADAGGRIDGDVLDALVILAARHVASGDVEPGFIAIGGVLEGKRSGSKRHGTRVTRTGGPYAQSARTGFQKVA